MSHCHFVSTNPTWIGMILNAGSRGEGSVTNLLHYYAAIKMVYTKIKNNILIINHLHVAYPKHCKSDPVLVSFVSLCFTVST